MGKRIGIFISLILFISFSAIFVVLSGMNKNQAILEEIFTTNISESSATLVFTTNIGVESEVVVMKDQEVVGTYFDERDMKEVSLGEYELEEQKKRIVHSVRLRGLSPESNYSFEVKLDGKNAKSEVASFKTIQIPDEIITPDPAYGELFFEDKSRVDEGVVIFQRDNGEESSQFISVVISKGSYTINTNGLKTQNLSEDFNLGDTDTEQFSYYAEKEREVIKAKLTTNSFNDQPIDNVFLNSDKNAEFTNRFMSKVKAQDGTDYTSINQFGKKVIWEICAAYEGTHVNNEVVLPQDYKSLCEYIDNILNRAGNPGFVISGGQSYPDIDKFVVQCLQEDWNNNFSNYLELSLRDLSPDMCEKENNRLTKIELANKRARYEPDKKYKKDVLIINFNPKNEDQQTLIEVKNWESFNIKTQEVMKWFKRITNGKVLYESTEYLEEDAFPKLISDPQYTFETYLLCEQCKDEACENNYCPVNGGNPILVDYSWLVDEYVLSDGKTICQKINEGNKDEVWIGGGPWFGYDEVHMVGPNAENFPGRSTSESSCNKLTPIMGMNYSYIDGDEAESNIIHIFGHRMEYALSLALNTSSSESNFDTEFGRFIKAARNYGSMEKVNNEPYGCGLIHYPPNDPGSGRLGDFDNKDYVLSYCGIDPPQLINCDEWECSELGFYEFWFQSLDPSWWQYILEPVTALVAGFENGCAGCISNPGNISFEKKLEDQNPNYMTDNGIKYSCDENSSYPASTSKEIMESDTKCAQECNMPKQCILYSDDEQIRCCEVDRTFSLKGVEVPVTPDSNSSLKQNLTSLIKAGEENKIIEKGLYEISGSDIRSKTYEIVEEGPIMYFYDNNKNGIKDPDEEYLTDPESSAIQTNILKIAELESYKMNIGWNVVSFPLVMQGEGTSEISKASELLDALNKEGSNVTHIVVYREGGFIIYSQRENNNGVNINFGEDFFIMPGEAYFVKNYKNAIVNLKGREVEGGMEILINPGWNLVGIYNEQVNSYGGFDLMKKMNKKGINVDVISKWQDGKYTNIVIKGEVEYGTNFTIYPTSGYWVKSLSSDTAIFKPD